MERWQNKVAVVTGASSGIGAATCRYLVERGMIVVGLARRLERMERELKPSLPAKLQARFHPMRCDVSKEQDIIKTFALIESKLGGVDVLVNNAGCLVNDTQLVQAGNGAELRRVIETNVLGLTFCTREAYQSMRRRNFDGHIININSVLGHSIPRIKGYDCNIYPPSKYAVTGITEVLRQEFINNKTKIKVTSISPGGVETEIIPDKVRNSGEFLMLRPEDVADAIVYCIQTPPSVQIHELTIKPVGELF